MKRSKQAVLAGISLLALSGAGAAAPSDEVVSPSRILHAVGGAGQSITLPTLPSGGDKTLAPYFVVEGGDAATDRLPLKETSAEVSIAGVIAQVSVHQVFANERQKPINAVYVFPASTRAAVNAMRMTIGARTIIARIDRREVARNTFETAQREGKRASLLEQERPNVFMMTVANVMPGDRITVAMDYSELLVPEESIYEFVYPTVVGPRYGGGASPTRDQWIASPYLREGQPEPYKFGVHVRLESGIPLKEVSSPSHELRVAYDGPRRADVSLATGGGGNRDFVLRYRLAGDRIETGALMWEGEAGNGQREGYFAVMMEPPLRPTPAQIPPREYIFLVDVSGSMSGFPLDTAKVLMRNLLGRLRPTDLFDVVLFSGTSATLSAGGSLTATPDHIAHGVAFLDRARAGGGTELMGGLTTSYGIPRKQGAVARTVVVITDGFVGVEAQAFRFVREHLGEANLFSFGIGSSVNRGLMEGLARAGLGEPFVVLGPDKAATAAEKLRAYIEQPVLTGIQVKFQGVEVSEVAPEHLPDLMARRPLVLYGKIKPGTSGRVVVTGMTGQGRFEQAIDLRAGDPRPANAPLRALWARKWIETLDDERHMGGGKPVEEAITKLGLRYSLLTAFTSFVAVDSQVANHAGQAETIKQPLPLPEGVSNLAVAESRMAYGGVLHLMKRKSVADDALESGSTEGWAGGRVAATAPKAAPKPAEPQRHDESLVVTVVSATSLGDSQPLVVLVRKAVRDACTITGELRLRLAVDAAGTITGVTILRGDTRLQSCLDARLLGKLSATRAAVPAGGTLELSIKPGRR